MTRSRRGFILCSIVLLLDSSGRAQAQAPKRPDPAKTALIEELLVALKLEQNQQQAMQTIQDNIVSQFNQMLEPQMKNLGADPEMKRRAEADVQDFQRRVFALLATHMSWQTMEPVYVAMYDETFTVDELRSLVAFFKSPAGQAYVDKTPVLMNNTLKQMQQVVDDVKPEIQRLSNDFMQQMKEKYTGKP
jgi:uncharacterized protein